MSQDEEFDKILESVGDKGRYQKWLLVAFYPLYCLLVPWIVILPIFLNTTPDHWCHVEGKPENVTLDQWKKWTIPRVEGEEGRRFSKCEHYSDIAIPENQSQEIGRNITGCQDGWEYDKTWYDETLVSHNDWVCEDSGQGYLWLTVGQCGRFTGLIFYNRIADIIGRKKLILFETQLFAICCLLRLYFNEGWLGFVVMFLAMSPFPSLLELGLIFVTEQISNSWRPVANAILFAMFTAGMCLVPLFAWLTRSWLWLSVIVALPFFLFIIILQYTQESARWLASRGRTRQALAALVGIAKVNGVSPPPDLDKNLQVYTDAKMKNENQSNLLEVLRSSFLVRVTIFITVCWISNVSVYYTVNYNVNNLGGNQFINFFLIAIVELPSVGVAWVCTQTIGRRLTQTLFLLLSAIVIACPIFFTSTQGMETVVCAVMGKIFINSSFYVIYLQVIEIFPTSHRSSLMGFSNSIVDLVNISVPMIIYSASVYWSRLPYLVMLMTSLCGCVCSVFIPESIDRSLPQTISDSEDYFKGQKVLAYTGRQPATWKHHLLGSSFKINNKTPNQAALSTDAQAEGYGSVQKLGFGSQ